LESERPGERISVGASPDEAAGGRMRVAESLAGGWPRLSGRPGVFVIVVPELRTRGAGDSTPGVDSVERTLLLVIDREQHNATQGKCNS